MKHTITLCYQRLLTGLLLTSLLLVSACGREQAPAIDVHDLIHPERSIALAHPNKPTLVVFWATSCSSCIEEIPSIIQLQQDYGDKIAIAAIALGFDDPTTIRNFTRQRQLPYLVAHDDNDRIAQGFGKIFVTPTNILLSPTGQIEWKNVGNFDMKQLKARIDHLLSP